MKLFNKKNKNNEKGFTLIEMMMVLAIFTILTGITVYNYGKFNNNVIITNLAYEISLAIREAQVFSLGVRVTDFNDSNTTFDTRYGVFFDISGGPGTEGEENFILFADPNRDGICNSDTSGECSIINCIDDECQNLSTLTRGVVIKNLCAGVAGVSDFVNNDGSCAVSINVVSADQLSITFERPNPNALVVADGNNVDYRNAAIVLEAPNGPKRVIYVNENGQISVDNIDIGS
jgi:prepilin-type N-terminal cleavage/methylation domain-containing protein